MRVSLLLPVCVPMCANVCYEIIVVERAQICCEFVLRLLRLYSLFVSHGAVGFGLTG